MDETVHSAKYHCGVEQEPLLPEAESFQDLFEDGPGPAYWGINVGAAKIGDYVYVSQPHLGFHRKPRPAVVDAVKATMLEINYDTIHFQIIRDGARAWVFACYGLIIGSRYLADIDASTIPEEEKREG